ncbi:hypothetical protein M3P05_18255 [Sansalvadorimonas sp. 2012CJ34-2]|uniref:Uncharacterized protein n=1 Tax=Parendozoicomonas callyspongiae TaxID=2942213 RepID=A0ABT0PKF4_9GAMM|nr:hypothetical protein [Sansalvadorimonas sp. 2012CJ34-2]MCL6271864.1 hypothetical protein [Sansalvadorimonas sp. 2012CJ34-2]
MKYYHLCLSVMASVIFQLSLLTLSGAAGAVPGRKPATRPENAHAPSSAQIKAAEKQRSIFTDYLKSIGNGENFLKKAEENDIDILDIVQAKATPPKYCKLATLHTQMFNFTIYLEEWLKSFKFQLPPKTDGLKKGKLPEEHPYDDFRDYLNDRDPLLLITLAHLIYQIRHVDTSIDAKELAYFELCIEWIEMQFPEGLSHIDWEDEYLSQVFNVRQTGEIRLPSPNKKQAFEEWINNIKKVETKTYLEKYWSITEYPSEEQGTELGLLTLWNAIASLQNAKMDVDRLSRNKDPLEASHVLFTIHRTLYATDSGIDNDERTLARIWLKLAELDHHTHSEKKKKWRREVRFFAPPHDDNEEAGLESDTEEDPENTGSENDTGEDPENTGPENDTEEDPENTGSDNDTGEDPENTGPENDTGEDPENTGPENDTEDPENTGSENDTGEDPENTGPENDTGEDPENTGPENDTGEDPENTGSDNDTGEDPENTSPKNDREEDQENTGSENDREEVLEKTDSAGSTTNSITNQRSVIENKLQFSASTKIKILAPATEPDKETPSNSPGTPTSDPVVSEDTAPPLAIPAAGSNSEKK